MNSITDSSTQPRRPARFQSLPPMRYRPIPSGWFFRAIFQPPRTRAAVLDQPIHVVLDAPARRIDAAHRFVLLFRQGAIAATLQQLGETEDALQRAFDLVPGVDNELALQPVDVEQLLRRGFNARQ